MRYFYGFICVCALSMMPLLGCSGDEGEVGAGSAGAAGTGGSAGASGIPIPLPQCVTSAYQIVFRGLLEPMDPLLRLLAQRAHVEGPIAPY